MDLLLNLVSPDAHILETWGPPAWDLLKALLPLIIVGALIPVSLSATLPFLVKVGLGIGGAMMVEATCPSGSSGEGYGKPIGEAVGGEIYSKAGEEAWPGSALGAMKDIGNRAKWALKEPNIPTDDWYRNMKPLWDWKAGQAMKAGGGSTFEQAIRPGASVVLKGVGGAFMVNDIINGCIETYSRLDRWKDTYLK